MSTAVEHVDDVKWSEFRWLRKMHPELFVGEMWAEYWGARVRHEWRRLKENA